MSGKAEAALALAKFTSKRTLGIVSRQLLVNSASSGTAFVIVVKSLPPLTPFPHLTHLFSSNVTRDLH